MREKLIQYVELLFAGASGSEEAKQEILQNTLDRYDDLIDQGKTPEAAYRLAMAGIGDIDEVLPPMPTAAEPAAQEDDFRKKLVRGIAIALYILCPVPLFILGNEIGLCLLLVLVAVATGLLIWIGDDKDEEKKKAQDRRPETELERSIKSLIGTVTLVIYLIVSFSTGAWHITWIIFPLSGAVRGLIVAILDLKEAQQNEKR